MDPLASLNSLDFLDELDSLDCCLPDPFEKLEKEGKERKEKEGRQNTQTFQQPPPPNSNYQNRSQRGYPPQDRRDFASESYGSRAVSSRPYQGSTRAQETRSREPRARQARMQDTRSREVRAQEARRQETIVREEQLRGPTGPTKVPEKAPAMVSEKVPEPSIAPSQKPAKQESNPAPFCVVRASSGPSKDEPDAQNAAPSSVEKSSSKASPVAPLPTDSKLVMYPSDSPHLKDWVEKRFDIPSETASILSGSHGECSSFLSFTLRLPISVMAPLPSALGQSCPELSHLQPHTLLLTGKSEAIVHGAQNTIDKLLGNPEPFFQQVKAWTKQKIHIFVDNSNIFLGAQFLDDVQPTKKNAERPRDHSVRLETAALAQLVEGDRTVCNRVVFGSSVHDQYKLWDAWREADYKVCISARPESCGEQFVDDALIAQIQHDLFSYPADPNASSFSDSVAEPKTRRKLVLLTGDGNDNGGGASFYCTVCHALDRAKWDVEVWAWRSSTSSVYKELHKKHRKTRRFRLIYLDDFRPLITYQTSAQDQEGDEAEEEELKKEKDPKKKREESPPKREKPPAKISQIPSSKPSSEDVKGGKRSFGSGGGSGRTKREEDTFKGKRRGGGREERRTPSSEVPPERYGTFKILPREIGEQGDELGEGEEGFVPRWEEEFEDEEYSRFSS